MGLDVVLALIREILPHEGAEMTAHTISRNRERAFGLFHRGRGVAKAGAVGGDDAAGYDVQRLVLLIRWGRDGGVAEAKSREVYGVLE